MIDVPHTPDRPLSPGEALARLFLGNADRGANAANDELVRALLERAREIQAFANPTNMTTPQLPETTAQE